MGSVLWCNCLLVAYKHVIHHPTNAWGP
jgi:hypothetical protein